ncbi:MAG TPA: hypothetical protein VIL36_19400 [Acidimicrobiales bacterium]
MPADLADVGLREGDPVRWRRHDGGHWQSGTVIGLERDGSVAVRDADGAWRSIVAERLEARRPNRRGRLVWQPVEEGPAQLSLWDAASSPKPSAPKGRRASSLRPQLRAR